MKGKWTTVYSGDLPLRSWWVDSGSDCEYISIVLPEVFGINHWIRSFSEKLASQNVPVLALPLYGRTAPKLDLGYSEKELKSFLNNYFKTRSNTPKTKVEAIKPTPINPAIIPVLR